MLASPFIDYDWAGDIYHYSEIFIGNNRTLFQIQSVNILKSPFPPKTFVFFDIFFNEVSFSVNEWYQFHSDMKHFFVKTNKDHQRDELVVIRNGIIHSINSSLGRRWRSLCFFRHTAEECKIFSNWCFDLVFIIISICASYFISKPFSLNTHTQTAKHILTLEAF